MKKIQYLLLCSLMLLLAACEKDTEAMNFAPKVTTGNATDIYRKGAVLSGSIQTTGTATAKKYGILFSELESMAEYTEYPSTDGTSDFSIRISNLTPGTTYYYCAYAHSGYSITKGQVKSFSTTESNAPIFSGISLVEKDEFSCTVSASLFDEGGSTIMLSGFCWNLANEGDPTTDSHVQNVAIDNNTLNLTISGLEPDAEYRIRAYATNSDGVGYSQTLLVMTDEATTPVLSAITEKESSDFSVTVEAKVTDAGTSAVTKAGFCWSTDKKEPTVDDNTKELADQLTGDNATLSATLADLKPGTTYYIRAYATNEVGTTYSEVFTFTTGYKDAGSGNTNIENLPTTEWK